MLTLVEGYTDDALSLGLSVNLVPDVGLRLPAFDGVAESSHSFQTEILPGIFFGEQTADNTCRLAIRQDLVAGIKIVDETFDLIRFTDTRLSSN